jgi:putative polyhydroxyalkanoate system protein
VADIRIVREHALGHAQARRLALRWVEAAQRKLQMECKYVPGETQDVVRFRRAGASGELRVSEGRFELVARLGLLLGVFRHRIEGEIVKNLDQLLASADPLQTFEQDLARHEAKHAARHGKPHGEPARAPGRLPAPRKAD